MELFSIRIQRTFQLVSTPYKAQILKNGSFFAKIHCFSNGESFAVESCCSIESDWFAVFHHSDINSIPLQKLLELLPI